MRLQPRLAAALALLLGAGGTASAAWDNVFQVCCNDCKRNTPSYYQPAPQACPQPCPQACPQPEVRVNYVQRCYYQPVTEYVRKSYYEPVTTNYTTYYYEPVTEYKYTTYYDPCTGCPQRVCTPCTSYKLRSKCNAVTSYVERCSMVPVTTLKPVTVRQPVVTYYYPPEPVCPPGSGYAPPMAAPNGPTVEQIRESQPNVAPDANIPQQNIPLPPGVSNPRVMPNSNTKLRPEKTVSRTAPVVVRGEVVMPDQLTPRPGAKLVFLNADNQAEKKYATANQFGEFDLQLPAGNWYVYLGGADGKATYHKQVSLGDKDTYDYKVVSR